MTQHITQEQAVALATPFGVDQTGLFGSGDLHSLCNAAIQHYIDSLPADRISDAGKTIGRAVLEQTLDVNELTAIWDAGVKWRDAYTSAWKGAHFKQSEKHYRDLFVKAIAALTEGRSALAQPQGVARIHVTDEMHRAAVKVLHRAHGVAGLPQRMVDAMLATCPQASDPALRTAGVAVLSRDADADLDKKLSVYGEPAQGDLGMVGQNLLNAWAGHTGAEPSESVLGRAIDEAAAALQSTAHLYHIVDASTRQVGGGDDQS